MKKVFLLFTLIICSFSFGQHTGSIQGNIVDGELFNEPLLMASVFIEHTSLTTHTNFRGNFEFNNLTPGAYTIVVQYLGYENVVLSVTVASGETKNIQASLKAKTLRVIGLTAVKAASK
ncbi:carboxypeptidase-like regulatory domain-containing protein [Maribacter sp. ACAM166]|uniref:carboxypeptidase-like regulatory domain-containing protein n=1 Tax=Maribacter sp. ACAM166 TaxID=2508996 RepID=UPI0010FDF86B|nr:carboxypeptidase-like regulatory domain-containing protein [Maribacter sp. ACAM166]TLP75897.1 carboxypeptidase-like regulatory domain-containing protein [Maribacter sp. ACAM166]